LLTKLAAYFGCDVHCVRNIRHVGLIAGERLAVVLRVFSAAAKRGQRCIATAREFFSLEVGV